MKGKRKESEIIAHNSSMLFVDVTGNDNLGGQTMKKQRVTKPGIGPSYKTDGYNKSKNDTELRTDNDFEDVPRTITGGVNKIAKHMKVDVEYDVKVANGNQARTTLVLRTRTSPKNLWDTVKALNENQRAAVREIGLGSLLDITLDRIPYKLGFYVVDNLDTTSMTVKLSNGHIPITVASIYRLLGLPIGGLDLNSMAPLIGDADISKPWKRQYTKEMMRPKDVMNMIKRTGDYGVNFKLNFLVVVVNTLAECSRVGCCNFGFLSRIHNVDRIQNIDWARYVYDCLKISKIGWKRDSLLSYYAGPLTYLTLLYVESTVCDQLEIETRKPPMEKWTLEQLRRRQDIELDNGGLGKVALRVSEYDRHGMD